MSEFWVCLFQSNDPPSSFYWGVAVIICKYWEIKQRQTDEPLSTSSFWPMLVLSAIESAFMLHQSNQQPATVHLFTPYINWSKMLLSITDSAWMLNKEILLPITGFVTLQIFILPFWLNDCDAITVPYVLETIKMNRVYLWYFMQGWLFVNLLCHTYFRR